MRIAYIGYSKTEATKKLSRIRTILIYSQFCKALTRLRRDIFQSLHKGRKHTFRIKHSPFNLIILAKLKTNQSLCARVENNCPINYSSSKSDDDFPHFVDSSVTVVQKTFLKGLPSRSDHMIIWINGANRVSKETVLWRQWGSYFILPDKRLKLETSAKKWWPIYIFDSVHETSLSCYTIIF